jgi:predicted phage-related endonuclease
MVKWVSNIGIPYEQWRINRRNSIGASEVGAILFGSKWTSNLEIWMDKVFGLPAKVQNLRMFLGNKTEPTSEMLWSFYDDTEQSIVTNCEKGTPVKESYNKNATAFNDKWPHLSATPDRIIKPVGKYAGRSGEGCLELKNTMRYVLSQYENSLPPENTVQLVTQFMVTELEYGELFYFIDNNSCECYPIEAYKTKKTQDIIATGTKKFWDSIVKARVVHNQLFEARRKFDMKLAAQLEVELSRLEPDPQTTSGYLKFLTERYKDRVAKVGMIPGNDEQFALAKAHRKASTDIKKMEARKMDLEIKLKLAIKDHVVLDFGKGGKITYYQNKNGSRLFKNAIK